MDQISKNIIFECFKWSKKIKTLNETGLNALKLNPIQILWLSKQLKFEIRFWVSSWIVKDGKLYTFSWKCSVQNQSIIKDRIKACLLELNWLKAIINLFVFGCCFQLQQINKTTDMKQAHLLLISQELWFSL